MEIDMADTTWHDGVAATVAARDHMSAVARARGHADLADRLDALVAATEPGPGGDSHGKRDDGSVGGSRIWAMISDTLMHLHAGRANPDLPALPRKTDADTEQARWQMWLDWATVVEALPLTAGG